MVTSTDGVGQTWWHTPLNPALRRQRKVDLWKSKHSLVYMASFRLARATQ